MKLTKSDILFVLSILLEVFKVCSRMFTDKQVNEERIDQIVAKIDDMMKETI